MAATQQVRRLVGIVVFASTGVAWQAAGWVWVVVGEPRQAQYLLAASAVAAVLAVLMLLHVRAAALALAAWGVGGAAWLVVAGAHPFYASYAAAVGLAGAGGAWRLRRLVQLYAEFATTWTPHEIAAGEVFTIRDGAQFGVVKVLATDPDLVHLRQYALRYVERPWQVKSSTLARAAATGGPGSFGHLPLSREEFARWEPVLLRSEPIDENELEALSAWRVVHGSRPVTTDAG